jgi:hypothetical protein
VKADPTKGEVVHASSVGLVVAFLLILGLAIALSVTIAAPILAVPFILVGFGVFLLWRGKRRAESRFGDRFGRSVPTTEETAGDPVADSSVPDAARTEAHPRPS